MKDISNKDERYENNNSLRNSLGDTIGAITGFVLSKFVNRKNCSMNKVLITLIQVILCNIVYTNKLG